MSALYASLQRLYKPQQCDICMYMQLTQVALPHLKSASV